MSRCCNTLMGGWGTRKTPAKWVSTNDLFNQLHARWNRRGTFPWRDVRHLGQHITSLRSTLETHYGFVEETRGGGTRWMRFTKRRDQDQPQAARSERSDTRNHAANNSAGEVLEPQRVSTEHDWVLAIGRTRTKGTFGRGSR
jgi:hypothetical protein